MDVQSTTTIMMGEISVLLLPSQPWVGILMTQVLHPLLHLDLLLVKSVKVRIMSKEVEEEAVENSVEMVVLEKEEGKGIGREGRKENGRSRENCQLSHRHLQLHLSNHRAVHSNFWTQIHDYILLLTIDCRL